MKKSVLYGIFLLCGIALMALSLVLEGRISDSVGGTMMGVGAGALGFCGSNLMILRRAQKDPAAMRQAEIEAKDERNVAIRRRAQAVSGEVLQWAVMGAALGVFLAKCVLELWLMVRYQREM